METTQPQAKTRLRDFASHDIPPLVAIPVSYTHLTLPTSDLV